MGQLHHRLAGGDHLPGFGQGFDDSASGVWVVDPNSLSVSLRAVQIRGLAEEAAVVSGVKSGERVVALGAHLLHQGERVRLADDREAVQ